MSFWVGRRDGGRVLWLENSPHPLQAFEFFHLYSLLVRKLSVLEALVNINENVLPGLVKEKQLLSTQIISNFQIESHRTKVPLAIEAKLPVLYRKSLDMFLLHPENEECQSVTPAVHYATSKSTYRKKLLHNENQKCHKMSGTKIPKAISSSTKILR